MQRKEKNILNNSEVHPHLPPKKVPLFLTGEVYSTVSLWTVRGPKEEDDETKQNCFFIQIFHIVKKRYT